MLSLEFVVVLGIGLCLFVGISSQTNLLLGEHAGSALSTALLFAWVRRDGSIVLLVVRVAMQLKDVREWLVIVEGLVLLIWVVVGAEWSVGTPHL